MYLDYLKFEGLFISEFQGNYHKASRDLGVDVAQIHRIVNKKKGAGLLFVSCLMKWCRNNNIDVTDLFFYPER